MNKADRIDYWHVWSRVIYEYDACNNEILAWINGKDRYQGGFVDRWSIMVHIHQDYIHHTGQWHNIIN